MKIGLIVGGWYYPAHLFRTITEATVPQGFEIDYYVASHRDPSTVDISREMLSRVKEGPYSKYDRELFSEIATYDYLKDLGYVVDEFPNVIGDYYFFNQWTEKYDYSSYDYIIFIHDDNYLLPEFKNIFTDIFEKGIQGYIHNGKGWVVGDINNFSYIANSAVGNRKTARGSFSIWTKEFIDAIGGSFPMEGVTLKREGKVVSPTGHHDLADWNKVGTNLQKFVQRGGFMSSTYRLSDTYRVSKYMIEGERGLISKTDVIASEMNRGYKRYITG